MPNIIVLCVALVFAATATAAPDSAGSLRLKLSGEVLYSHYDYGPDQKSSPNGSPPDSRAIFDLSRVEMELKYFFSANLYLETEVEFEHGGTGSAMELEYEEFGEFEFESEKGGEVVLEEFHVTRIFARSFNLRLGHIKTAFGLLNRNHNPTQYMTAVRPEGESEILPSTWHENGVETFGTAWRLHYRLQLVNGLDSSGFSSKHWIKQGYQARFEQSIATDMAVVARLDYTPFTGGMFGISAYRGNTTGNRPKPDMEGISGVLTMGEVYMLVNRGPFRARGHYMRGHLQNADLISAKNSRLSAALEVPRTPVAEDAESAGLEAGFDLIWLFRRSATRKLYAFGRYDHYDAMAGTDPGVFNDPRFERMVVTGGVNFYPHPAVVLKADYAHRTLGRDDFNDENTFSIALGVSTTLFER